MLHPRHFGQLLHTKNFTLIGAGVGCGAQKLKSSRGLLPPKFSVTSNSKTIQQMQKRLEVQEVLNHQAKYGVAWNFASRWQSQKC